MRFRKLAVDEAFPFELLLLADPSLEEVEAYLKTGDCYVLEENQEIVGTYVLLPLDDQRIELKNLAVAEAKQGQGLGKSLIEDALKVAKQAGYQQIEVGTGNSSIGPLALYQKMAFKITSVDKDYFVRNYGFPIYENGVQCRDMIRLSQQL